MKTRAPSDPRRLDVAALARAAGTVEGVFAVASFERLAGLVEPAPVAATVAWSARGEIVAERGGGEQVWLHLKARVPVVQTCQRCMQPLPLDLVIDKPLRFVGDEDEAARLDAEIDDDVLVLERELDLHALLEDECLLALPLVPRHPDCVLPAAARSVEPVVDRPFAALGVLKGRSPSKG